MRSILLISICNFIYTLSFSQNNEHVLKYINQWQSVSKNISKTSGIPAAIIMAQAIHESGAGQSELTKKSHNHFGIKCHSDWTGGRAYHDDDTLQECFRVYELDSLSFVDHALFLKSKKRYAFLFDIEKTNYVAWANGLKKAGYATNPLYAQKIIETIEKYTLYEWDNGVKIQPNTIIENDEIPPLIFENKNALRVVKLNEVMSINKLCDMIGMDSMQLISLNDLDSKPSEVKVDFYYLESKHIALRSKKSKTTQTQHSWLLSHLFGLQYQSLLAINHWNKNTIIEAGQ